jgi:hypothetical protein
VRRIKGLLPVLANEEDGLTHGLTHEDQVEQQGSQAALWSPSRDQLEAGTGRNEKIG